MVTNKKGLKKLERMVTMLPISAKMHRLKKEVIEAITVLESVNVTLKSLEEGDNLTEKIGYFLRNPPIKNISILYEDFGKLADLLRKVCSGEKTPKEASENIEESLIELQIIGKGIYLMEQEVIAQKNKKE